MLYYAVDCAKRSLLNTTIFSKSKSKPKTMQNMRYHLKIEIFEQILVDYIFELLLKIFVLQAVLPRYQVWVSAPKGQPAI